MPQLLKEIPKNNSKNKKANSHKEFAFYILYIKYIKTKNYEKTIDKALLNQYN